MRARFHPEATAELEESADWYAQNSKVACREFLTAIEVSLTKIVSDPNRFPWIDKRHQTCSVTGFPFQIVFRHAESQIEVIAFVHAKRRPGYWKIR